MKTSKLTGAALDWAVATCEFEGCEDWDGTLRGVDVVSDMQGGTFNPSSDWAQGGAIIEREGLGFEFLAGAGDGGLDVWVASLIHEDKEYGGVKRSEEQGTTPLIAAMRCYVASKLGDEVQLPEELNVQS